MRRAICQFTLLLAATAANAAQKCADLSTFDSPLATFEYCKKYFEAAEMNELPKQEGSANPSKRTGPLRWVIALRHAPRSPWRGRGRYYFPAHSAIFLTPLEDTSVSDFAISYPSLVNNARKVEALLPLDVRRFDSKVGGCDVEGVLPDEPFSNAAQCLLAHYRRLDFAWGSGIRLLSYYTQDIPAHGATNVELQYNFQGVKNDGKTYVSARFAVRHPKLPDSIDDPRGKFEGTSEEQRMEEQRAERRRINAWSETSFFPPLSALDEMLSTMRFRQR